CFEKGRGRSILNLISRNGAGIGPSILEKARRDHNDSLKFRYESILNRQDDARAAHMAAQRRLDSQSGATTQPAEPALLAQLHRELDESVVNERQAARELFDLARDEFASGALKPMTASQIGAALKPGELLLAYDIGPDDSILFL